MCRGADLGVCCAGGCDAKIRCQDTGGYCPEHDPYDISWSDDEDDTVALRPLPTADDPQKRRAYTLARLTGAITSTENSIRTDERRLADMRSRLAELASPESSP